MKAITPKNMKALAKELLNYFQKNEYFYDMCIYVNNERWSSNCPTNTEYKELKTDYGSYYITKEVDVTQCIEYNNPKTVTVTFEGPLYESINYGRTSVWDDINQILAAYNLYAEQGYAWSFAAYQ